MENIKSGSWQISKSSAIENDMGKLIIEVPVWGGGELWQVMVGQGGRRHRAA